MQRDAWFSELCLCLVWVNVKLLLAERNGYITIKSLAFTQGSKERHVSFLSMGITCAKAGGLVHLPRFKNFAFEDTTVVTGKEGAVAFPHLAASHLL